MYDLVKFKKQPAQWRVSREIRAGNGAILRICSLKVTQLGQFSDLPISVRQIKIFC